MRGLSTRFSEPRAKLGRIRGASDRRRSDKMAGRGIQSPLRVESYTVESGAEGSHGYASGVDFAKYWGVNCGGNN